MSKATVTILGFSLLSIGAIVLTTGLQENAYNKQNERLDAAVNEAEKDMGVYDEETATKTPAMKRVIDLNRAMNARAAENQAMLDSLIEAESETVGAYEPSDSTANDY